MHGAAKYEALSYQNQERRLIHGRAGNMAHPFRHTLGQLFFATFIVLGAMSPGSALGRSGGDAPNDCQPL